MITLILVYFFDFNIKKNTFKAFKLYDCTEVCFPSLLSDRFAAMAVINTQAKKLTNLTFCNAILHSGNIRVTEIMYWTHHLYSIVYFEFPALIQFFNGCQEVERLLHKQFCPIGLALRAYFYSYYRSIAKRIPWVTEHIIMTHFWLCIERS